MIKLIWVGKIKEAYLNEATNEYLKRLTKYTKLKVIEIAAVNQYDTITNLKKEGEAILSKIEAKDYVITLEIDGLEMDSVAFAHNLNQLLANHANLTFIVGGSDGLDETIKKRSNQKISFSALTFPHQLFRVLLLEQIYRAYKINNNETYHK